MNHKVRLDGMILYQAVVDGETKYITSRGLHQLFDCTYPTTKLIARWGARRGYSIEPLGKLERQVSIWEDNNCIFSGPIKDAAKKLYLCHNDIIMALNLNKNQKLLGRYVVKSEPLKLIDLNSGEYIFNFTITEEEVRNT